MITITPPNPGRYCIKCGAQGVHRATLTIDGIKSEYLTCTFCDLDWEWSWGRIRMIGDFDMEWFP